MVQPAVIIQQGKLQGVTANDIRGNKFYKFKGIPYAKPPLGNLRFKSPQPPEKWSGVLDASKDGDVCYARDPLKNLEISGSENCLVLNVYTGTLPDDESQDLRPVLFWIHGGGFVFGNGSEELYGPDFLVTEDVVLVVINYRLGLLGFISFEDPSLEVPGNAGLKDQLLALKWVQENISKFGGDPNNVTIFGESAGGASVHSLILSPSAKGLFHKAIAQSGSVLNPWVEGTRGVKSLAKILNLEGADERTIYNTLIKKSVEELYEVQEKLGDKFVPNYRRAIGLVIEKNSKDPFLNEEPLDIMLSGRFNQVPFMTGYTTGEGMVFQLFENIDVQSFAEVSIPWNFGYQQGSPEEKSVVEEVRKFYFGNEKNPEKLTAKKFDLSSDVHFVYGIYLTIMSHYQRSKAPIFLYKMSVETKLNFFKKILKIDLPGVSHCDDVGYLFKHYLTPEIKPGSIEDLSLTRFVKLWTNFAKYGNPTPEKNDALLKTEWKPVTGPNLDFLDIGEELVAGSNPDLERIQFWEKVFKESPTGRNFYKQ